MGLRLTSLGVMVLCLVAGVGCERRAGTGVGVTLSTGCIQGRPDAAIDASAGPLARTELCNNGLDDDQNGLLDEGCRCAIGDTQRCYSGWPATAGVGTCARGEQRCEAHGSVGSWGACVGSVAPSIEHCNGLDDNCNGHVDEGCECAEGTTQPCFVGSERERGVGACTVGVQTCEYDPIRSVDGSRAYTWGACTGAVGGADETCNSRDDDCDGDVDDIPEICDLADNDCDMLVDEGDVCAALPAARMMTRYWTFAGGSGVFPPSAPLHTFVEVAPFECAPGEVLFETSPGIRACIPTPPVCEEPLRPMWVDGAWACIPCELLVQFGGLFAYERVCAPVPTITCPDGQVPTFLEGPREWRCVDTCNNGEYDRALIDGELICVPC